MLKILTIPNPILFKPSQPVKSFDTRLKTLVREMEKTLAAQVDPQGVGLAAPQIGENIQVFIMKPKIDSDEIMVCVNPTITDKSESSQKKQSKTKKDKLEGCLSVPKIWSPVKREKKVKLSYYDIEGKHVEREFKGFEAIIVQHEVDHLNGVLFTQRALEQGIPVYEEDGEKLKKVSL